jgi:hypothetical protein
VTPALVKQRARVRRYRHARLGQPAGGSAIATAGSSNHRLQKSRVDAGAGLRCGRCPHLLVARSKRLGARELSPNRARDATRRYNKATVGSRRSDRRVSRRRCCWTHDPNIKQRTGQDYPDCLLDAGSSPRIGSQSTALNAAIQAYASGR